MAVMKANILKVKVYPKDLKSIPDILPFNQLLQGDPMELELTKKEIWRCMHFGDVFDMSTGEEVLIDRLTFEKINEFVENEGDDSDLDDSSKDNNTDNSKEAEDPIVDKAVVDEAIITE